MASLIDLAEARLRGLLDVQRQPRPSMVGLLGGKEPQGTLASTISGYTPPQMQAMSNQQVMDYARNVASSARQNLQNQMSDLDKALVMDQGGINVGDRQALARLMEQIPGLMGAVAYHGTPHTIRGKFDISKVGTGEGAQAYGHGMYFAEAPEVAKTYIKAGDEGFKANAAEYAIQQYGGIDQAIQKLTEKLKNPDEYKWVKENTQTVLDGLNKLKKGEQIGNLYKVDIPDEYIPNMLDWDKPLLQQTPQVQEALAKLGIKSDAQKLNEFDDALLNALFNDSKAPLPKEPINPTGQDIYQTFIQGDPVSTSRRLSEVGIKGIRYLDEGSRSKGKGTSNFVVFDPTEVKILEKNKKKIEGLLD